MAFQREPGFATLAIHAGTRPDPLTGARISPINQSVVSAFSTVDQARDVYTLNGLGALHPETANPTVTALEERVAALEGGTAAVATASGGSAIMVALGALLETGDEFITAATISGATFNQFEYTFRNAGWNAVWVNINDTAKIEAAITPRTKAIFAESVSNPAGHLTDIPALADIARRAGLPLIIDNTLATPYLIRPLEYGADIVVYAASAFLSGHGHAQAGLVVDGGTFDWEASGLFAKLTDPRPEYDGLVFNDAFGNFAYSMVVRALELRDTGALLSPVNAALVLGGIETLPLRMEKHVANAKAVADYLRNHNDVEWISQTNAPSAVFTFALKQGDEAALAFIEAVQLFTHSAHSGDTRSTVIHPSSTTHAHMPPALKQAGFTGSNAVRLSIGLEDAADLIADIEQAIAQAVA